MEMQEGWGQGPTPAGVSQSGSHLDSQIPDYWQKDTQLNFVRFSVFVESKEIFKQFNLQKTTGTLNDVIKHVLFC